MNLPAAKEASWWPTYLKAAIFLTPAFALWTLAVIFIFPKLQQISADAGGLPVPGFLQTMVAVTDHGVPLLLAAVAVAAMLEWFSAGWIRYRKIVTGVVVFLLNSAILSSFFAMLVSFAVVAPALINVGK